MAIQEGLRRVNRLSAYVAGCSLVGLLTWLAESLTTHRWGSEELWVLIVVPLVIALFIRIVSWLLAGFFQNPPE
jgi:lipopolysaccharide export LptBFGC system permease protein LptF